MEGESGDEVFPVELNPGCGWNWIAGEGDRMLLDDRLPASFQSAKPRGLLLALC